ncbi:putative Succinate-CoA ligase subunit beta protein, partial [Naja naja]
TCLRVGIQLTPRRWLNLQEYQSKKLMADHGVTVQKFFVADTANDAIEAAKRLLLLLLTIHTSGAFVNSDEYKSVTLTLDLEFTSGRQSLSSHVGLVTQL